MKLFRTDMIAVLTAYLLFTGAINDGGGFADQAAQWARQTVGMSKCDVYSKWKEETKECQRDTASR